MKISSEIETKSKAEVSAHTLKKMSNANDGKILNQVITLNWNIYGLKSKGATDISTF